MKKQIGIIALVTTLVIFGLCGCVENDKNLEGPNYFEYYASGTLGDVLVKSDTNKIIINMYDVYTNHHGDMNITYAFNGFVPSENSYEYLVRINVTNNADESINHVEFIVNYYDGDNTLLNSKSSTHSLLTMSSIESFDFHYGKNEDGFNEVEQIDFQISVNVTEKSSDVDDTTLILIILIIIIIIAILMGLLLYVHYRKKKRKNKKIREVFGTSSYSSEEANKKPTIECPNCGRGSIPYDAKLCPYCGNKF